MSTATPVDVAVVGAGVSGLAVAVGLQAAGRSVRVVEARPRVGGRIETAVVNGGFADLGPTWFWPGERRVIDLVKSLGLEVHQQWDTGDAILFSDGQARRVSDYQAPPSYRFVRGAAALTEGLLRSLDEEVLLLNTPASRVERGADVVQLTTAGGQIDAGAVVLALPPSLVMASGMVDPSALDPQVAAAASEVAVWMGSTVKTVVRYDRPFWRDAGLSGFVRSYQGPLGEIHDMSGPDGDPAMLFGFGQTRPGQAPPTDAQVLAQLTAIFGPDAATARDVIIRDWSSEPFTSPGQWPPSTRYDLFGSPHLRRAQWDGRLYWSSTETGSTAPGHIEGALDAAERTVALLTA